MPTVLMVSTLWPPVAIGGAEVHAARLAARLEARGWSVGVVTGGVPGERVVAEVDPFPYRLDAFARQSARRRAMFHAADVYRPATGRVLASAIQSFRPDVVHTHSVQGLSSVALAAPSRLGRAHVHTIHDYWLRCQRTSMVQRDGTACDQQCRSCAAITSIRNRVIGRHPPHVALAVSEAVAREHESIEWLRGRLRVLYNPLDRTDIPRREPRSGPVVFGYLGQLSAVKGVATLLDAFGRAHRGDGARLLVAGDGALRDDLTARAEPGVELLGWVDDAQRERFFADIDALVVPSEWHDPAPLVVNEAVARGVPVIGARTGGIPELVPPSCAELLFTPRVVGELTDRFETFARDRTRWVVTAPPGALDWDAHVDAVVAAYEDARDRVGTEADS